MKKMKEWDAEKIKALRHRHNLSQAAFAELIGCRQQTISEWELGFYNPGNAYNKVLTLYAEALREEMKTN